MIPFQAEAVLLTLRGWFGKQVFLHLEVNPGAYWRNGQAVLDAVHVKGDGSFRMFLELDGQQGLIQVDELTHMLIEEERLICTGYDDRGRLARTIEIGTMPFSMSS